MSRAADFPCARHVTLKGLFLQPVVLASPIRLVPCGGESESDGEPSAAGGRKRGGAAVFDYRHDGEAGHADDQSVSAWHPTWLVHNFGNLLDDKDRLVAERLKVFAWPDGEACEGGQRMARDPRCSGTSDAPHSQSRHTHAAVAVDGDAGLRRVAGP